MDGCLLKYDLLSPFEKKEVGDFIDFLFSKKEQSEGIQNSEYKNRILAVSTWSEDDLKQFEENAKSINKWQPPTW